MGDDLGGWREAGEDGEGRVGGGEGGGGWAVREGQAAAVDGDNVGHAWCVGVFDEWR